MDSIGTGIFFQDGAERGLGRGGGHLEVCRGRGNAVRGKVFVVAFVAGVLSLIVRTHCSILQAL